MSTDRQERERIPRELDRNLLVEAAAGTGKTTAMVGRMVALLRCGRCPGVRQLAAVTFTRKAAAELRARFQLALERAAAEAEGEEATRLRAALEGLEQGFVGTIHAFCARLLRERPVEAGVDLAFEEIDEDVDLRLRHEAWDELTARELAGETPGLIEQLDQLGLSLTDLRAAFVGFADYPDVEIWPVGESTLPDLVPVVELVRDYVAQMRALGPLLPAQTGTDTLIPAYRDLPRLVSHHEPLDPHQPRALMEVLAHFRPKLIRYTLWVRTGNFTREQALAEAARWEQMCELARGCLEAWQRHRYGPALRVLEAARAYHDRLRAERGLLSFQDLLLRAAAVLRESPHVRRYFAGRYTHLLVDEFQDTDPVQAEVLLLLAARREDDGETDWRRCQPRPGALFAVGDPKQSIYRFRRADIVTYNQVKRIIEDGGGRVVRLARSFRAGRPLVEWVNAFFAPRFPVAASDESPAYVALEPGREEPSGGVHVLTIPQDFSRTNAGTVRQEARCIARTIRDWIDRDRPVPPGVRDLAASHPAGLRPGDFMIVTHRRANLSVYARELTLVGVPHQVTGGTALNEVPELRLLQRCLEALVRPDDPLALVAALRSELFGVSDAALYAFHRAGGRFSFHAKLPQELDPVVAAQIGNACERLRTYERWLAALPPLAAIEKLTADLGLPVLAAARPGGDLEAGSLAKALELLRVAQRQSWTLAQLVDYLGLLADGAELHDGARALPGEGEAVRVMNLHKAKGLEAPVVFLADPTGQHEHGVRIHVDRSGERSLGYLAIHGERVGPRVAPLLALPDGWEAIAAREQRFLDAERLRLLYVAATRAGSLLVITQRERANHRNPWADFAPALLGAPAISGAELPPLAEVSPGDLLTPQEVKAARDAVEEKLALVRAPTQGARPAREYARWKAGAAPMFELPAAGPDLPDEGEHGAEWGTVIHALLQAAMGDPRADLLRLARAALAEQALDPGHAALAVETVSGVLVSRIWQRARLARRRLSEVPFQVLQEGEPHPTVVRGVIDLAFDEGDGWVVVDYKTERPGRSDDELVRRHAPQVRLYAEALRRCTGEAVKELGLLMVRDGARFVPVPPGDDLQLGAPGRGSR